ncbi:unnamed protein product [Durusdinium trenchii]|uniref:Uncharacterized protein n=1 Tax=Durusdinium trenchii TaxID=1381693 RepID=A0ABP0LTJ9_9DINO
MWRCCCREVATETTGAAQVSNGAAGASGAEAPMWRDRDPPPNFDGDVEGFNQYVRDLKLWRHDTDVPERKHGVKVLRGLSGQAKAICNELSVEELTSTGSVDLILAKLREHYSPHLETTMPKAFEKAVYGEPRKPKESICDFVIRQDAAFRELHEEGFARSDVVKALRKLEKIQKEKPGSRYMTVEDETFMTEPIEGGSDDSGDYVYLGEDDLNHIYEEEEIQEALATYQQVRKAIQEQKNNRGYYGPGVSGKGAAASSTGTSSPKAGFFEVGEHTTMNVNDTYQVTLGQFIKKGQNRSSFVGLTTSSHVGIIDTAAQGGLIGRRALDRLGEELRKHRLKVQWSTKQAQARGIGGEARVVGVVEIPVGIAGVNGLIEATVVEEDVPFLLSIKFLQQVKATISLSEQELHLGAFGRSTKLQEMPTGHVAVDGSTVRSCGTAPSLTFGSEASPMDLFNRMVKIEQMASRSNAASSASPHSPERATAHWRTVMEKVAEVMELARAQARVKGWQEDGFELGSRVPSSAVSAPPASAYSSPPATTEAGISSSDSSQNPVASHELSGESTSSKFTGRHSSEDHPTQCGDVQEERKAQEFEQVIEKEKNEVINQTMAMAEQRHQALMLDQHVRHEMEKETLQN